MVNHHFSPPFGSIFSRHRTSTFKHPSVGCKHQWRWLAGSLGWWTNFCLWTWILNWRMLGKDHKTRCRKLIFVDSLILGSSIQAFFLENSIKTVHHFLVVTSEKIQLLCYSYLEEKNTHLVFSDCFGDLNLSICFEYVPHWFFHVNSGFLGSESHVFFSKVFAEKWVTQEANRPRCKWEFFLTPNPTNHLRCDKSITREFASRYPTVTVVDPVLSDQKFHVNFQDSFVLIDSWWFIWPRKKSCVRWREPTKRTTNKSKILHMGKSRQNVSVQKL